MRKLVGAVLFVAVLAGISVGVLALVQAKAEALPDIRAQSGAPSTAAFANLNRATVTLETFPFDPYEDQAFIDANVTGQKLDGEDYPTAEGDHPDWVKYWPTTNLVIPAHSLVTIKIINYDGPTALLNSFYARAQGTVDPQTGAQNTITVDGKPTQAVAPEDTSHTFTIHSIPDSNQPWLYVSVPVTAVPDSAPTDDAGMPNQPVVTEFSFFTGDPGSYIWQCFDPCGAGFDGFGGPMSTKGFMSGTVQVV